jgi:hypothetical protein
MTLGRLLIAHLILNVRFEIFRNRHLIASRSML